MAQSVLSPADGIGLLLSLCCYNSDSMNILIHVLCAHVSFSRRVIAGLESMSSSVTPQPMKLYSKMVIPTNIPTAVYILLLLQIFPNFNFLCQSTGNKAVLVYMYPFVPYNFVLFA